MLYAISKVVCQKFSSENFTFKVIGNHRLYTHFFFFIWISLPARYGYTNIHKNVGNKPNKLCMSNAITERKLAIHACLKNTILIYCISIQN